MLAHFGAALALAQPAPGLSLAQEQRIDHLFAESANSFSPGAAVLVKRGGQVLYRRAFGMADLERQAPLTPDSRFFVASVSKQVTAFCVLLLEHDGRLRLDDSIRKHIPELPAYAEGITLRMALNHTAGLRDYYSLWDLMGWGTYSEQSDRQVLDLLAAQQSLNFAPGAEYSYSNSGYFLAKLVVERASGRSLREFAEERIFAPLGMTQSSFADSLTRIEPGRALGHTGSVASGLRLAASADPIPGARGLLTTLDDFSKWVENLKSSRLAGGPGLMKKLLTMGSLADGEPIAYGLGIGESRTRGLLRVGHSGFYAGFRSRMYWLPEIDAQVLVFANTTGIDPTERADRICEIAFPDAFSDDASPAKPPRLKVEEFVPAAHRGLVGFYRSERAEWEEWTLGPDGLVALRGSQVVRRLQPVEGGGFFDRAADLHYTFEEGKWHARDAKNRIVRVWSRTPRRDWGKGELANLSGEYSSAELGVDHVIEIKDGKLWHRCGTVEGELKPTPVGDFDGPFGRVEFGAKKLFFHGSRVRLMELPRAD